MTMNRRNVLIGIGALVGGGGAALGSGAFSQAEAQRTIEVELEGDDAGVLQLDLNHDDYAGVDDPDIDGDMLEISFTDINEDAVLAFDDVLEISVMNDTDGVEGNFEVTIEARHGGIAVYDDDFDPTDRDDAKEVTLSDTLNSSESVAAGFAITTGEGIDYDDDDPFDDEFTDDDDGDILISVEEE